MNTTKILITIVTVMASTSGRAGQPVFEITRSTIDGGGVMRSTGDDYELSGTIGQFDAGVMTEGEYELTGGFWFGIPPGDCEDDGDVDLFDYDQFQRCMTGPDAGPPAPGCNCFDLDQNDTIDLLDFAITQTHFTGP